MGWGSDSKLTTCAAWVIVFKPGTTNLRILLVYNKFQIREPLEELNGTHNPGYASTNVDHFQLPRLVDATLCYQGACHFSLIVASRVVQRFGHHEIWVQGIRGLERHFGA